MNTADGFTIDTCRSCNAAIIWATTKAQKLMPVDAEPSDDGNVQLLTGAHGRGVFAQVLTGPTLLPVVLRTSHFATCPEADKWRRDG